MDENTAKEYVIKTILTGNAKTIAKVIERYRVAFGKKETIQPGVVEKIHKTPSEVFTEELIQEGLGVSQSN